MKECQSVDVRLQLESFGALLTLHGRIWGCWGNDTLPRGALSCAHAGPVLVGLGPLGLWGLSSRDSVCREQTAKPEF